MIVRMCELDAHFTSVSPPPAAPFAVYTIHYKCIQQALWWHPAHFKLFDIFFLPGQRRTVICMCMSLCSQNSSWNITEKVHCYQIQRFSLDKREKEKWQLQSRVIPRVTVYPNRPLNSSRRREKKNKKKRDWTICRTFDRWCQQATIQPDWWEDAFIKYFYLWKRTCAVQKCRLMQRLVFFFFFWVDYLLPFLLSLFQKAWLSG